MKNYSTSQKSRQGYNPQISRHDTWSHRLLRENLWACPWWDQTLASIGTARPKTGGVELTYTESSGRKTGSILAPPSKQIRKAD